MADHKFYAKGNNVRLNHPLPVEDIYNYPIQNGVVKIFHYPDDSVVVQIIQQNKQPDIWVNREFTVDASTNSVNVIPKNT